MATVDHRRAIADRNRSAILDATERLLAQRSALSMAAVAAEAGVSRPTLYAHFKTLADILDAAVRRAVERSMVAITATEPDAGRADQALARMLEASWSHLATLDALAQGAAEHLPAERLRRSHAPLMALTIEVIERGQREGTFRTDLPAAWPVSVYYSLIHGADDLTRHRDMGRREVLAMLKTTIRDVFAERRGDRT